MVVYLSLVLLESQAFVESPRNLIGLGGCKEDVPDSERFQPTQRGKSQFLSHALPSEFLHDLNFSDVGKARNSWSEERFVTDMPVEEASVSAVDLSDEKAVISQLPDFAGVAERVSRVV